MKCHFPDGFLSEPCPVLGNHTEAAAPGGVRSSVTCVSISFVLGRHCYDAVKGQGAGGLSQD